MSTTQIALVCIIVVSAINSLYKLNKVNLEDIHVQKVYDNGCPVVKANNDWPYTDDAVNMTLATPIYTKVVSFLDEKVNKEEDLDGVEWPSKMILAMAWGYPLDKIKHLVYSFETHVVSKHADDPPMLVLFAAKLPDAIDDGVAMFPIAKHVRYVLIDASLQDSWRDASGSRYVIVDTFLQHLKARDDPNAWQQRHVVTADVRDTVFFNSPFIAFPVEHRNASELKNIVELKKIQPHIHFFWETITDRMQFNSCNYRWVSQMFGADVMRSMHSAPIINSGCIIGTAAALQEVAHLVVLIFTKHKGVMHKRHGYDQGIVNFLVTTNQLGRHTALRHMLHSTELSRSFVGNAMEKLVRIDDKGNVNNLIGEPYIILHQYDRVPLVKAAVEKHMNKIYDSGKDEQTKA